MLKRRRRDVEAFKCGEYGNCRRDRTVAIDQCRAEKTGDDNYGTPALPPAEKRHQRQNPTFAVVVDAHGDDDIFDRRDQKQRPNHQRKNAEDAIRGSFAAEKIECGLKRIERACSNIAEPNTMPSAASPASARSPPRVFAGVGLPSSLGAITVMRKTGRRPGLQPSH